MRAVGCLGSLLLFHTRCLTWFYFCWYGTVNEHTFTCKRKHSPEWANLISRLLKKRKGCLYSKQVVYVYRKWWLRVRNPTTYGNTRLSNASTTHPKIMKFAFEKVNCSTVQRFWRVDCRKSMPAYPRPFPEWSSLLDKTHSSLKT